MSENQKTSSDAEPDGLPVVSGSVELAGESELGRLESDLLVQTAAVVEQIQAQADDLARREKAFRSQQGQLDQERRAFRYEQQQFETDTARARNTIDSRREELAVESDQLRQERAQLRADREVAATEFRRLQADRAGYRQELQAELHQDRAELQASSAQLDERQNRLAELEVTLEKDRAEFRESQETARVLLDEELTRRRAEVESQIEADRSRMVEEVNEAAVTQQLRSQREQLEKERRRFRQDIEEWEQKKKQETVEFRRRQEQFDAERRQTEQEIDELRRGVWDEIDAERVEHQTRLLNETRRANEKWEQSQEENTRQRAIEESRIRFQQDHLQRLRDEIETAQNQLRVEYQKSRRRLEEMLEIQRLRDRQLNRRREMYLHLEHSLARRQDTVAQLQHAVESHSMRERERLGAERKSWELKLQSQNAENRRQADLVALHAEDLEKRRSRLDALRTEIEARHSKLLETQLAVDETWAQLSQVTGDDRVQERVAQSRTELSEYSASLRESFVTQQAEVQAACEQLESQRLELQRERQQLTEVFDDQEQHFRRRENSLTDQLVQVEQQEADWRETRDAWFQERLQSEQTIHNLLAELSEASATQGEAVSPAELLNLPGLSGLLNLHGDAA